MDELTRAMLPVVANPEHVTLLYNQLREFCHDICNDLSRYRMQIYLARRDPSIAPGLPIDEIEARYQDLERFVAALQLICRPMQPMRMPIALDLILEERHVEWTETFAHHGRSLHWTSPAPQVNGAIDPGLLTDALDALVGWRAEVGSEVQADWCVVGDALRLNWAEPHAVDGSGGERGINRRMPCLALALVGRVFAAHGGTLTVNEDSGFHLEGVLPLHKASGTGSRTAGREFHAGASTSRARTDHAGTGEPGGPSPGRSSRRPVRQATTSASIGIIEVGRVSIGF